MTSVDDDPDRDADGAKTVAARLTATACPVCGKPTVARYRPFCSRRCADVDLSRWLGGAYVVPGHEPADPGSIAEALRDGEAGDRQD